MSFLPVSSTSRRSEMMYAGVESGFAMAWAGFPSGTEIGGLSGENSCFHV